MEIDFKARDEEIERMIEKAFRNAKIVPESKRIVRGRSSLHQFIKTKAQADRFMKLLELASSGQLP